jgi:hypothetical protein
MTQEDQDAVVGRLVREKREAEARRAILEEEAGCISTNLRALAQNLDHKLASIQLKGSPLEPDFITISGAAWLSQSDLEEPKRILGLANEYRQTLTTLKTISRQLKHLGLD